MNLSFEEEKPLNENLASPQEDKSLSRRLTTTDEQQIEAPTEGLVTLMGKDTSYLESRLGRPERIDESEYGYSWWIYKQDLSKYVQIGVENGEAVTLYAIGPAVNISPFTIGQPVSEIYSSVPIEPMIDFEYSGSSYRFELNENDMNTRPLIKIGEHFVQLNIDKFDGVLSSVRVLNAETLIKLQPYELVYKGELLEPIPAEEDDEAIVSQGIERQIFDITNVMRVRHHLSPLELDEKLSEVALTHSIGMHDNIEFPETSETPGELSNRLEQREIIYDQAGENIAVNYADAPAVMEGWLNSKGHRETLLNGDFSHMGIGVFKKYYTQNFIQIPIMNEDES